LSKLVTDAKSADLHSLTTDLNHALPSSLSNVAGKIKLETIEQKVIKVNVKEDLDSVTHLAGKETEVLLAKVDKALIAKASAEGIPTNKVEVEHFIESKISTIEDGKMVASIPITEVQVTEAQQFAQKVASHLPMKELKEGLTEVNKIQTEIATEVDAIKDKIMDQIETQIENKVEMEVKSRIALTGAQESILVQGAQDYRAQLKLEKANEPSKPEKEKKKKKKKTHEGLVEKLLEQEIFKS